MAGSGVPRGPGLAVTPHQGPVENQGPSVQTEWVFSDEGMTFLPNARPGLPETPHGIPI